MYDDNSSKLVVILNKKIEPGISLNAFGHIVLGLGADLGSERCEILDYSNSDAGLAARISKFPVIVLGAKNSNQLRTTYSQACESGIEANAFVTSMIASSAEEQVAATANASADELEYVGIALYGSSEELDPLTKRFSLMRSLG